MSDLSIPAACASLLALRAPKPAPLLPPEPKTEQGLQSPTSVVPVRRGRRFWETVMASPSSEEICKMNIPCARCGVRFRKPGHLNMHWRSVHGGVPPALRGVRGVGGSVGGGGGRIYGCPQCEARFRRGSDRNRHMRMVHAKIRPYKCLQCGNQFGRRSFLEAHVLTVHEKRRPFRCDCGAAFGQRSSLTRHIKKIHGKGKQPTQDKVD